MNRQIVIVGAGITGLSTAIYLQKALHATYSDQLDAMPRITLLEQSNRIGGKLDTAHQLGMVMERGADSFLAKKQAMLDLADDLGLSEQLIGTSPLAKKVYIATERQLLPFPAGLKLAIPTQVTAILRTPLLSLTAKLRVLADLFLPSEFNKNGAASAADESLGQLLARRFGSDFAEQICEPILAGIYAGDLNELSVQATFPQFADLERRQRSLMIAMKHQLQTERAEANIQSMFLAFKGGFSQLTDTLLSRLTDVDVRRNCKVESIVADEQTNSGFTIFTKGEQKFHADEVVLTVPSFIAANMFKPLEDDDFFRQMQHISVANVVLAFHKENSIKLPSGSGFLVPRKLNKLTTACTWTSQKWPHSTPNEYVLLRAYVGRSGQDRWQLLDDSTLTQRVIEELRVWIDIPEEPFFTEVNRWSSAMPQYAPGHVERLNVMRQSVAKRYRGLHLIGASYDAVGLPDCVKIARITAENIASNSRQWL